MKTPVPDLVGTIPGTLDAFEYQREDGPGTYPGGEPKTGPYRHDVKARTETFALSDGGLYIRSEDGRPLWVDIDNEDGTDHPFTRRSIMSLWYDNPRKSHHKKGHHRRHSNPGLAAYLNRRHHNPLMSHPMEYIEHGLMGGAGVIAVIVGGNYVGAYFPTYYTGSGMLERGVRFLTRAGVAWALHYVPTKNPALGVGGIIGVVLGTALDLLGVSFVLGVGDQGETAQSLMARVSMPALTLQGQGAYLRRLAGHGRAGAYVHDGMGSAAGMASAIDKMYSGGFMAN